MFLGVTVLAMVCSGCEMTGPAAPAPAVASVTIEPVTRSLGLGGTYQLKVLLYDGSGRRLANRQISFSSSDEQVLSVDASGLVRALAVGEATLTASSEGKSGWTRIHVLEGGDPCLGCWDSRPTP
jgi:uncharacterized protein YjdB